MHIKLKIENVMGFSTQYDALLELVCLVNKTVLFDQKIKSKQSRRIFSLLTLIDTVG
jgi:hypothetical protein